MSSTAYSVCINVEASDGSADGCAVGIAVALNVGTAVISTVGGWVALLGVLVGIELGCMLGGLLGDPVGANEGNAVKRVLPTEMIRASARVVNNPRWNSAIAFSFSAVPFAPGCVISTASITLV
jgi:phage tail tape-measure protein